MADEVENNVDDAQGFEVTTSDIPEVKEESTPTEEPASSTGSEPEVTTEAKPEEESAPVDNSDGEPEAKGESEPKGDDTTANPEKKSKKGVEKRIGKLVKEREAEKRENADLKRKIAELEGKKDAPKEPIEDDFETHDAYLEAIEVYEGKTEESTPGESNGVEDGAKVDNDPDDGLTGQQQDSLAVLNDTIENAEDLPEDFKELIQADDLQITGEMIEALAECEDPAKVMYHLGQNKDLAAKISKGNSIQQIKAIDNLDKTVGVIPPKPVKLTNVNDVMDPVKGTDVQGKTHTQMSFSEYEKSRASKSKATDGW